MANEEHLKILRQGHGVWNRWWFEHRDVRPDLREADLNIDHRTLEKSGNLPLSFLRGCGLPDEFTDQIPLSFMAL